jgi:hypothetical protein
MADLSDEQCNSPRGTVQDRFIVYSSLMTSADSVGYVDQRQQRPDLLTSNAGQPAPTGQNTFRGFRVRVTVGEQERTRVVGHASLHRAHPMTGVH